MATAARISPVTGRYVTSTSTTDLGGEYKVFYLENGKGQPLVCQHTAGCHNHQWRGLLEDEEITGELQRDRLRPARHGKSDPPNNSEWWKEEYRLTADYYTKFIVAFCDALELEDPIFMGSSFGGNVALQLALPVPDRFARHPGRGGRLLAGLLPRLVAAPARQRGAGLRQRRLGPDGAAVARPGPLADLVLLHAGLGGVPGRPVLLLGRPRPARSKLEEIDGSGARWSC